MTSLWTLPTPEPIRQSVVRWACRFFLCLPECCCPFRLQLHFNFKQLIVVAMPRGPVEKTFTAFLLILRPNNHGTIGRTLLPTTTGHCSSMNQMLPPFLFDSTGNENQSRASMSPQNKDNMFCGCLSGMAGRSVSEYEPVWARLVSTIALYLVTSSAFTICHGLCAYVTRMVEQREERDKGVAASLQAVENKEYCEKSIIGFHPCGYLI